MALALVALLASALVPSSAASGSTATTSQLGSVQFGFHQAGVDEQLVRAASDMAPGSFVRINVEWQGVEPGYSSLNLGPCKQNEGPLSCQENHGYDRWGYLDWQLGLLKAEGLKALLVPISAPGWARSWAEGCHAEKNPGTDDERFVCPPDPLRLNLWQNFNKRLVQRVKDKGFLGTVLGIEMWNEPDGTGFWTGNEPLGTPNPARYADVLCTGFRGVRAVPGIDPPMPVLFAGLATLAHGDWFLDQAYKRMAAYEGGANSCMTWLGMHRYQSVNDPAPDQGTSPFVRELDQIRRIAKDNGDEGRKIAITEVGFFAAENDPVQEQKQGDYIMRAYRKVAADGDVTLFALYIIKGNQVSQWDRETQLCVPTLPWTARPAAHVVKQEIGGSTEPATCGNLP